MAGTGARVRLRGVGRGVAYFVSHGAGRGVALARGMVRDCAFVCFVDTGTNQLCITVQRARMKY